MQVRWTAEHGNILLSLLKGLRENGIRYFIIRGFEGLPQNNYSKDVDIMIENGKLSKARECILESYRDGNLEYYYEASFGHANCYWGMSPMKTFSIHIDLIEGYVSKGFEVVSFDEMYMHTVDYRGMIVLDPFMNGIMLLIYKIFGYHNAKLKTSYRKEISNAYKTYPGEFEIKLNELVGVRLAKQILGCIKSSDYDALLNMEPDFTRALKKYTWHKRPVSTIKYGIEFWWQKIDRIVLSYKKYARTFAVLAPDGTGKTTFLEELIKLLNFYYVRGSEEETFHIYHFRPNLLPNLGEVGEKAGVMKQDKNFTEPHRNKPANPISSFLRCSYYTLDYIIGWQKCIRHDVHYDKYSVFDRYSYDLIVDPLRTKLNLPVSVRKFFVALTPKPKIVFVLDAGSDIIFARKQELPKLEIDRQLQEYRNLSKSNSRFKVINAERQPGQMAEEAVKILLSTYTHKL